MTKILFRVRKCDYGEGAEIHIATRNERGDLGIAQPMVVVSRDVSDSVHSSPAAVFMEDAGCLQGLMDELWQLGVRPSDIGTPGHLAATQAHLSDMRKLVEKTLEVKL